MTTAAPAKSAMLDKVRKLLAQADDVAGTPEADAFNAKAFELIARYGIDETEARQRAGQGPAPIEVADFTIAGKYQTEQINLLHYLASALHCEAMWIKTRRDSLAGDRHVVYGTAMHIERVRILFSTLMPQMMAGAANAEANPWVSTQVWRRSWMRGFAATVHDRLAEAEKSATVDADAGTALVLVDDRKRASQKMYADAEGSKISQIKSKAQYAAAAGRAGSEAASKVDLGGASLRGSRALGR
ncbi:DUF2786 domain-containing protein [Rhodococcoides fascians]|uniref:DUF2786 domain-containing protein n=1 Tax=Rhodococcoides fascians TaxID=1828 RepID=UPI0006921535|nr:DUF2786 domain-containing protein [Rhodococcus fascians]